MCQRLSTKTQSAGGQEADHPAPPEWLTGNQQPTKNNPQPTTDNRQLAADNLQLATGHWQPAK